MKRMQNLFQHGEHSEHGETRYKEIEINIKKQKIHRDQTYFSVFLRRVRGVRRG